MELKEILKKLATERIIQRALAQVIFSGREEVKTIRYVFKYS